MKILATTYKRSTGEEYEIRGYINESLVYEKPSSLHHNTFKTIEAPISKTRKMVNDINSGVYYEIHL